MTGSPTTQPKPVSTAENAPGPGARAVQTAARRARLLDTAVALASDGGYDAVQMRDVAARANVALGTLYRHYSSKDQLLLAALATQARQLRDRLTERPALGPDASTRVGIVLRRASRSMERDPNLTAAMVTALSSADPDAGIAKHEVFVVMTSIFADAIGEERVDLEAAARALGLVWFSALAFWVGGLLDSPGMERELESAARLILR
ncbi:MAG: transcriptional regulator, TetR family [Actinomycetia bacterium]|nr:transcriptional regulator, TetR family [Actinomycetes bacterium]